jgi:hypothetical protein
MRQDQGGLSRCGENFSAGSCSPTGPAPLAPLGAPMEGLMELVAACFARHGVECPTGDLQWPRHSAQAFRPAEPTLTAALPEGLQGDPAP